MKQFAQRSTVPILINFSEAEIGAVPTTINQRKTKVRTPNEQRNIVLNRCALCVARCAIFIMTLSFCSADLFAQEVAGQGWTVSESRQRDSNTILARSGRGLERLSPEALVPARFEDRNSQEPMPPFPVLMPKSIVYPRKAVRKGWEGQAVVAAEVLPDGSVGRTAIARSSGHDVLDQAAQEGIRSWKFGNESEKDEAVPQFVDIPVTFKLQSED